MITLTAEICNITNERIVSEPSGNIKEPLGISPNMLIFGTSISGMSYGEATDLGESDDPSFNPIQDSTAIKTWKRLSKVISDYKSHFRDEWLQVMRARHAYDAKGDQRNNPEPAIGDLCIIPKELTARALWERAKIIEILPSSDMRIRACKLQTASGHIITRPLSKIYPILHQRTNDVQKEECEERMINSVQDSSNKEEPVVTRRLPRAAKEIAIQKTREMLVEE